MTPWTALHQASLSITNSWSLLNLMSTQSKMPSHHLILCHLLLLLPWIFPSIRVYSSEERTLEKEMATHSSIFACRIPWTEEPGGLWFMGLQRVGHNWAANTNHTSCPISFLLGLVFLMHLRYPSFSFLIAWEKLCKICLPNYETLDMIWEEIIYFTFFFLKLEDNCFTVLWWFLQYISANQS